MNTFQKLFAVSPDEIKQDVIITPFLNLEYFSVSGKTRNKKGFLFEVLNENAFSVIKTGVGAPFVGDALMYLKETKAKRVYFIGSCGASADLNPSQKSPDFSSRDECNIVYSAREGASAFSLRGSTIGDLVLVGKVFNLESFSDILIAACHYYNGGRRLSRRGRQNYRSPRRGTERILAYSAELGSSFLNTNNNLYKEFLRENKGIKKVNSATVGSLSLQENILPLLNKHKIDVVDMEVSAFAHAANFLKFSYLALLYVTDILGSKPFHRDLINKERLAIQESRQKAISLICDFIRLRPANEVMADFGGFH